MKYLALFLHLVILAFGEDVALVHGATIDVLNDLEVAVYSDVPLSQEGKSSLLQETFNKLDIDGNGLLSAEEREDLYGEIFEMFGQFFTTEGSNTITKQSFADNFITFQVPADATATEDLCNFQAMSIAVDSETAWNEIVGSDREAATPADLGKYVKQLVPTEDWTFEDYIEHVANDETKETTILLEQPSSQEELSLVKIDDIKEQTALCPTGRRQMFLGAIFGQIAKVVATSFVTSVVGNGLRCIWARCTWSSYWKDVAIGWAIGSVSTGIYNGGASAGTFLRNVGRGIGNIWSGLSTFLGRRQLELPQPEPTQRLIALERESSVEKNN